MISTLAGIGLSLASLASLRLSWARENRFRTACLVVGWITLTAAIIAFGYALGGEIGIPFAVIVLCLGGLGFVLANREVRPRKNVRSRDEFVDPSDRKSLWWRGFLRTIVAGPLGGLASIGVGVAFATRLPLQDVDAIAIGGLSVPLIWAGCMAWTLSDDRILRAFAVLISVSAASYGAAFLIQGET